MCAATAAAAAWNTLSRSGRQPELAAAARTPDGGGWRSAAAISAPSTPPTSRRYKGKIVDCNVRLLDDTVHTVRLPVSQSRTGLSMSRPRLWLVRIAESHLSSSDLI